MSSFKDFRLGYAVGSLLIFALPTAFAVANLQRSGAFMEGTTLQSKGAKRLRHMSDTSPGPRPKTCCAATPFMGAQRIGWQLARMLRVPL